MAEGEKGKENISGLKTHDDNRTGRSPEENVCFVEKHKPHEHDEKKTEDKANPSRKRLLADDMAFSSSDTPKRSRLEERDADVKSGGVDSGSIQKLRVQDQQIGRKKPYHKRMKYTLKLVLEQMEFYFGDSNLSKDRFLKTLVDSSTDGYVDLCVFGNFNKLQSLHKDGISHHVLLQALNQSKILELNEDKTKVRRITPFKEISKDETDKRTVYVEHLPSHASHAWIRQIFSQCGKVVYVSLPTFRTSKQIKGFAFVEFESAEQAERACSMLNNPLPSKAMEPPGKFPKSNKTLDRLKKFAPDVPEATNESVIVPKEEKHTAEDVEAAETVAEAEAEVKKKKKKKSKKKKPSDSGSLSVSVTASADKPASEQLQDGKKKKKKRKRKLSLTQDQTTSAETCQEEGVLEQDKKPEEPLADKSEGGAPVPNKKRKKKKKVKGDKPEKTEVEKGNAEEGESKISERDKSGSQEKTEKGTSKETKSQTLKKSKSGNEEKADTGTVEKVEGKSLDKTESGTPEQTVIGSKNLGVVEGQPTQSVTEKRLSHKERKLLRQQDIRRKKQQMGGTKAEDDQQAVKSTAEPPADSSAQPTSILKLKKAAEKKKVEFDPVPITTEFVEARGVRKRKKQKREKCHLRVIAKKEWLSLKEEYINHQKSHMQALKESLRELKQQENIDAGKQTGQRLDLEDVFGTKPLKLSHEMKIANMEKLKFTPNVIVQWWCTHEMHRDKIKTMFKETHAESIAYIDASEEAKSGYIRFKDETSAEEFAKMSRNSASFMARVLPVEQQEEYWEKANRDRLQKLGRRKKDKGSHTIARKVFQRNKATFTNKPNRIVFDDDDGEKDNGTETDAGKNKETKEETEKVDSAS